MADPDGGHGLHEDGGRRGSLPGLRFCVKILGKGCHYDLHLYRQTYSQGLAPQARCPGQRCVHGLDGAGLVQLVPEGGGHAAREVARPDLQEGGSGDVQGAPGNVVVGPGSG